MLKIYILVYLMVNLFIGHIGKHLLFENLPNIKPSVYSGSHVLLTAYN